VKYFTPCIAIIGTISVEYSFMGIFVIDFFCLLLSHFLLFSDHIKKNFQVFGDLIVDWPHKVQTKALYPPKGK